MLSGFDFYFCCLLCNWQAVHRFQLLQVECGSFYPNSFKNANSGVETDIISNSNDLAHIDNPTNNHTHCRTTAGSGIIESDCLSGTQKCSR